MIAEKLEKGKELTGLSRTITEGEFAELSNLTWITGTIHVDKEYMKKTPFGERMLGGQITLAIATALNSNHALEPWGKEHGLTGGVILGYENVRFLKPVFPGDTLSAKAELIDARDTRDGKRVVTQFRETATNQRGELVLDATRVSLWEPADQSSLPW